MTAMKTYTTKQGIDNTELFFKCGKLVAIAERTRLGWRLLSFPSYRLLGVYENLNNVIPTLENQKHQVIQLD